MYLIISYYGLACYLKGHVFLFAWFADFLTATPQRMACGLCDYLRNDSGRYGLRILRNYFEIHSFYKNTLY